MICRFRSLAPTLVFAAIIALAPGCKRKTETAATPESTTAPSAEGSAGSTEQKATSAPSSRPAGSATPQEPRFAVSKSAPPAEIWKLFSGEKAFDLVRKQVEIGPRPAGSPELEKTRKLIEDSLKPHGWVIERQEFTDQTPRGPIKFINLIARFSADGARPVPQNTQKAIVCSHFDTKKFSTIQFVGASDGASSTGALIELGRVLALDPVLASKIELVFFDGEEALNQFTETDGLYGSRYYAKGLRESGRARQFQFGILWDMIGDADLTITLSPDSPVDLTKGVLASADALGLRQHFRYHNQNIWDDHVPLNQIQIPTVDLIDFDYFPWHTADDTLDKLSPASLQKIGAITLHYLKGTLGK